MASVESGKEDTYIEDDSENNEGIKIFAGVLFSIAILGGAIALFVTHNKESYK